MKILLLLLSFFCNFNLFADKPWILRLTGIDEKIDLIIDLYEESIEVPTMEMFGPMNGYLGGDIYGVWYITSFTTKGKKAELKVANDLGSETQRIELTQISDTTWRMNFLGTNAIRRVHGRKLVKVPDSYLMKRK